MKTTKAFRLQEVRQSHTARVYGRDNAGIEHELKALTKQLPEVQRLLAIPGIGLLTATAIVGFVGDLRRFPSGRRFSSYLGLVPKENSSGDIRRFGRITKRGDSYVRMLLGCCFRNRTCASQEVDPALISPGRCGRRFGFPGTRGETTSRNGMPHFRARTWIHAWGKMDIKEARAAPGPKRARPATPR